MRERLWPCPAIDADGLSMLSSYINMMTNSEAVAESNKKELVMRKKNLLVSNLDSEEPQMYT